MAQRIFQINLFPSSHNQNLKLHTASVNLRVTNMSAQMRGLPSILSLFCNILRKFNNTGARISSDIKITLKSLFGVKILRFCHCVHNIVMDT